MAWSGTLRKAPVWVLPALEGGVAEPATHPQKFSLRFTLKTSGWEIRPGWGLRSSAAFPCGWGLVTSSVLWRLDRDRRDVCHLCGTGVREPVAVIAARVPSTCCVAAEEAATLVKGMAPG